MKTIKQWKLEALLEYIEEETGSPKSMRPYLKQVLRLVQKDVLTELREGCLLRYKDGRCSFGFCDTWLGDFEKTFKPKDIVDGDSI